MSVFIVNINLKRSSVLVEELATMLCARTSHKIKGIPKRGFPCLVLKCGYVEDLADELTMLSLPRTQQHVQSKFLRVYGRSVDAIVELSVDSPELRNGHPYIRQQLHLTPENIYATRSNLPQDKGRWSLQHSLTDRLSSLAITLTDRIAAMTNLQCSTYHVHINMDNQNSYVYMAVLWMPQ